MTNVVPEKKNLRKPARSGQGWCLPRPIRTFGGKLMEQQLWCWGRDIEYPDGNLLMRFGIERRRDPTPAKRSTCYRLDRDDLHVCLWGFGMFFGRRDLGGLYLDRFEFCPKWAPVESLSLSIHWPDELPVFARPRGRDQWQRARKLWKAMLIWIADYETSVRQGAGIEYRRECVEDWLRPIVSAQHIPAAWRFLSRRGWERKELSIAQAIDHYTIPQRLT